MIFRCYYCYTEKNLADRDRLVKPDRFKSMELNEAYISLHEVEGACKDYALVLVDTLGNGASSVDDEKAQHNMKNCDFAFVLVDSLGNLTDQDIDFFGSTLFNPKGFQYQAGAYYFCHQQDRPVSLSAWFNRELQEQYRRPC